MPASATPSSISALRVSGGVAGLATAGLIAGEGGLTVLGSPESAR